MIRGYEYAHCLCIGLYLYKNEPITRAILVATGELVRVLSLYVEYTVESIQTIFEEPR